MGLAHQYARWVLVAAWIFGLTLPAKAQEWRQRPDLDDSIPVRTGPATLASESSLRLAEIQAELAWLADPATFSCQIAAQAVNGVLEVRGVVPSDERRRRTLLMARANCSMMVVDKLVVRADCEPPSRAVGRDVLCRSAVTLLARTAHYGERFDLNADAMGQIVISTVVPSYEEKLNISRRLSQLPGCTSVVNKSVVCYPQAVAPVPPPAPGAPVQRIDRDQRARSTAIAVPVPPEAEPASRQGADRSRSLAYAANVAAVAPGAAVVHAPVSQLADRRTANLDPALDYPPVSQHTGARTAATSTALPQPPYPLAGASPVATPLPNARYSAPASANGVRTVAALGAPQLDVEVLKNRVDQLERTLAALGAPVPAGNSPNDAVVPPPPAPVAAANSDAARVFFSEESGRSAPYVWGRAEYLHWWFKDASAPPLVTTGPPDVLPTLDRPGTVVLFGNRLDGQDHPGGRFVASLGLPSAVPDDPDPQCAVEGSYFFASPRGNRFVAASPGVPILGRPFFDISTGVPLPVVQSVANPDGVGGLPALSGSVTVANPSRMYGFELNAVCNLFSDPPAGRRLDVLFGFRHVALHEDLSIVEDLFAQDGSGEHIFLQDRFSTRNDFFGGQIGVREQLNFGSFFVRGTAKLALGVMHHKVGIDGYTTDSLPGLVPGTAVGGLLTQITNIGKHENDSLSVVPEGEIQLGCYLTENLRVHVGYSFLYLSRVARPADQIDLVVNTNLIPTFIGGVPQATAFSNPLRPSFELHRTDFWAQGISAGVELSW